MYVCVEKRSPVESGSSPDAAAMKGLTRSVEISLKNAAYSL